MGNSFSNLYNSVVGASIISGCKDGGFVVPSESLKEYREGCPRSEEIVKVKSLKVMKRNLPGRGRLSHEFALIELHEFPDQAAGMVILAEKNYRINAMSQGEEGQSLGGVINISTPDLRSLQGPQCELKCRIELRECGGIVIKDLLNDLTNHNARYSAGMNNCWKYAYEASCKLLERCEEHPDTSRETKEAIKHFLETTLVKPELLGERVTLSKITWVGVGCLVVAGVLVMCWYNPLGVGAQSVVRGLGIGLATKNFVTKKAIRNSMIFVSAAVCSGIVVYGCAECGIYYRRVTR